LLVALVAIFALIYLAIALEHPIGVSKSASALLGAGLLWTIYAMSSGDHDHIDQELSETVVTTAQIAFFLMGAMTIVEMIDAHDGFEIVTSRIRTASLATLLWLVSLITFVLSAILDNLTTTIVMVSLTGKLLGTRPERLLFASMIVIAANAGGAWSPLGDVTTTMLWIGGQVTASGIVRALLLPSVVNLLVPLAVVSRGLAGKPFVAPANIEASGTPAFERNLVFGTGLGVLLLVPAFKQVTHLPPFMGMLLGLGILWIVGEFVHRHKDAAEKERVTVGHALTQIDLSSIMFFVGILLAVATLEHAHILTALADWLDHTVKRQEAIVLLLGLLSAVVDNVPLVAASIAMYDVPRFPTDSLLWEFIAYCAGTGGSILIIGSAAGVAAMGIENIRFGWYMRRISALALLGYFAGAAVYIAQHRLLH
jgi:Na+/H+ antiporter NhaD/arsenite permease-like protein